MLLLDPQGSCASGEVAMNDVRGGVLSPWLQRKRLRMGPAYLRGRVLDYGCGDGQLATVCGPKAYLGVDINLRALDQARAAHPGFRFATSVSGQERFGTVAAFAFIEHVADPGAWLARFASLLEPDGRIVLTTPHPSMEWAHTPWAPGRACSAGTPTRSTRSCSTGRASRSSPATPGCWSRPTGGSCSEPTSSSSFAAPASPASPRRRERRVPVGSTLTVSRAGYTSGCRASTARSDSSAWSRLRCWASGSSANRSARAARCSASSSPEIRSPAGVSRTRV